MPAGTKSQTHLHKKREVPGNDLAGDADGFVAREADVISGDRNRLAVNLVRPSGVISIALEKGDAKDAVV